MRKIKILFLTALIAVICSGLSSCKKDEVSSNSLVGQWYWAEKNVTFTFTADGNWNAKYAGSEDKGTYVFEEDIIYLTYVPEIGEPIWGRRWELRNDISSTLKVEVYDEDGYQGTMTLTRK